jgi:Holliday junction resolvase-like predicted endonuclease
LAQRRGAAAEALVADRLESAGWTIVGRNVRVGRAEMDIVAVDPGPPATLVLVEVRFRSTRDFGLPEESVDRRKRRRLLAALSRVREAGALPDGTALPRHAARLDLVVVEPGRPATTAHRIVVRHHRHVA